MRRRIVLLGRGGTVLIAIGCATLLASLMPSASIGSFGGGGSLMGKTWEWVSERILTPQQSLSVSITANNTIKVYLLEVSYQTIINWINENYPQSPEPLHFQETYLMDFLETNPQTKAMEKIAGNGKTTLEYIPTKITNITLILHNPNPGFVKFNIEGSVFQTIVPKAKMQTLSQIIIPLGFVLAIPWIIKSFKVERKTAPS